MRTPGDLKRDIIRVSFLDETVKDRIAEPPSPINFGGAAGMFGRRLLLHPLAFNAGAPQAKIRTDHAERKKNVQ
jgi:hypothetical protein